MLQGRIHPLVLGLVKVFNRHAQKFECFEKNKFQKGINPIKMKLKCVDFKK